MPSFSSSRHEGGFTNSYNTALLTRAVHASMQEVVASPPCLVGEPAGADLRL